MMIDLPERMRRRICYASTNSEWPNVELEEGAKEIEALRARVGELEKAAKEARLYLIGGNLIECNNELEAALRTLP